MREGLLSFSVSILVPYYLYKVIHSLIHSTITYGAPTMGQGIAVNKNRQKALPLWSLLFNICIRSNDDKGCGEKKGEKRNGDAG